MNDIIVGNPKLNGFGQHGILFTRLAGNQAIGTCPFCGRAGKFYANIESRLWDCKACSRSGNFVKFLEYRAISYQAAFKGAPVARLSKDRYLRPQTFRAWGVGWTGTFYSIPTCGNSTGNVTDISRYFLGKGKRLRSRSTSGTHRSFFVPQRLYDSETVWITEGEWDGMALWEMLQQAGIKDDVYATPGASSFQKKLLEIFYRKNVIVLMDNDEAGARGAQRISGLLTGAVRSLSLLQWPPDYPKSYDIRDLCKREKRKPDKILSFIRYHLKSWAEVSTAEELSKSADAGTALLDGIGLEPEAARTSYREWLYLPDSEVLDVLFGSVFANRLQADPLWLFFVAPPGGSKSELLMSLHNAPLIYATTTLSPKALISGANFGGGDPSLIPKLNGKVLVIKDFTTILSMNMQARDEILGTLRDAYDGEIEKEFANGIVRRYHSQFGIVAGVTPVIERFGGQVSVLGERFIKYRIRHAGKVDGGTELIDRALENVMHESQMRTQLRSTARDVLNRSIDPSEVPEITKAMARRFRKLAQWVASLRGVVDRDRYTGLILFKPMQELGTRLAKQFCTLALGISVWKQEPTISQGTYQTIVHIAQDTAPDRVEEVVKQLYLHRDQAPVETKDVSDWTRFPDATTRRLLQDLELLHVVNRERDSFRGSWRLSLAVSRLIDYLSLYEMGSNPRRARRI